MATRISLTHVAEVLKGHALALLGWLAVLIVSLLVYDAMLLGSLDKELWTNREASARVAVETLRADLSLGVRYGKHLTNYAGLGRLLDRTAERARIPLAVLGADGRVILARKGFPGDAWGDRTVRRKGSEEVLREDDAGRTLMVSVPGSDRRAAGWVAARIDAAPIEAEIRAEVARLLAVQAASIAAGLLLLCGLVSHFERGRRRGRLADLSRSSQIACMALFLLVMLANAAAALHTVSSGYTQRTRADAFRTGEILTDSLARLVTVGISIENTDRIDAYLKRAAEAEGGLAAFEILSPDGHLIASSVPEGTKLLGDPKVFPLPSALSEDASTVEAAPALRVTLLRAPWLEQLRVSALDLLTVGGIAFIFMLELFFLLTRLSAWRALPKEERGFTAQACGLLRPLNFFIVIGTDLSVSFLPLRMAEILPPDAPSRTVMMALAVSGIMAGTGITVFFGGGWLRRAGARLMMTAGIAVSGSGSLLCFLTDQPWLFIIGRLVVGLGFGLCLITSVACSVRKKLLVDVQAGIYAGSLTGCALGALLAEHVGFRPVFLLEAVVMLSIVAFPVFFLPGRNVSLDDASSQPVPMKLVELVRSICDRRLLAFFVLLVVPYQLVMIGCCGYLAPVYLAETGYLQSDIGRVYMLLTIPLIFVGNWVGETLAKLPGRRTASIVAAVITAAGALVCAFSTPLIGFSLGAIVIGLGSAACTAAFSEYLVGLDVVKRVGIDRIMSLYEVSQRLGKTLGPIVLGALIVYCSAPMAAVTVGAVYLAMAALFLLITTGKSGS
ncbi:MFS transporter [Sutterella sp.]|uniref:MFS transporter n=1 Tax=Sutterella sp. TaxID=1981025 RepID=UPI0026E01BE4|nr:MFS transporter [Sutterella sp.]MDO5532676.1 MFS transporter [Sutterella sp.]